MILKKSKTKWIKIDFIEDIELFVEYPKIEQVEKMRELAYQIMFITPDGETVVNIPEDKAKRTIIMEKIAKLRIKYCVKDWKGVKAEDGTEIKCNLVKDELEKDIYESFISNLDSYDVIRLGNIIQQETEFNEADKKK